MLIQQFQPRHGSNIPFLVCSDSCKSAGDWAFLERFPVKNFHDVSYFDISSFRICDGNTRMGGKYEYYLVNTNVYILESSQFHTFQTSV